jgi:hypothetical protein
MKNKRKLYDFSKKKVDKVVLVLKAQKVKFLDLQKLGKCGF